MPTKRKPRLGHDRVFEKPICEIFPSLENNDIYRPVVPKDPELQALAESIRKHGVKEPLVITEDGWILSGHRRHAAAKIAGLTTVPVRVEPIRQEDDPDGFITLLREFNRQREKSLDERLREELVSANPVEAYQSLIEHRERASQVCVQPLKINGWKKRSEISKAKLPFLTAVLDILDEQRKFWPLSVRRIHYALLNDPPLCHASKPDSRYANTKQCYKSLVDLTTRARLTGDIPNQAISDETRPITTWNVHPEPGAFIRKELNSMLKGYWRNLMQSQPNHIEIVVEKNTVEPIVRPIAAQYCIPLTRGRGYCSLPPRLGMRDRFHASGKERLVLLMLSDFDPDGEEIAHSFARSMRDDCHVLNIHPIKVALTANQVAEFRLPPQMQAKETSAQYSKFAREHGKNVFELEALSPEQLQQILRMAIDKVLDVDAFNAELDAEKQDAAFLQGVRQTVMGTLKSLNLDAVE